MSELRPAVAAAYLIAALMALFARRTSQARDRRFWLAAAALLLVMASAKQLQLQDEVTGTARDLLKATGWYDWHEDAQNLIGLMIAGAVGAAFTLLGSWLRRSDRSVKIAGAALSLLVAFVAVRAASFHAMDAWVTREALGLRLGWWVELAAIAVFGGSALVSLSAGKRSP